MKSFGVFFLIAGLFLMHGSNASASPRPVFCYGGGTGFSVVLDKSVCKLDNLRDYPAFTLVSQDDLNALATIQDQLSDRMSKLETSWQEMSSDTAKGAYASVVAALIKEDPDYISSRDAALKSYDSKIRQLQDAVNELKMKCQQR